MVPQSKRVALLACVLPLSGFVVLAYEVEARPRLSWDVTISRLLPTVPAGGGVIDMLVLAVPLAAVSIAVLLFIRGRRRDAVFSALAIGGVLILDPLLKRLFQRPPIEGFHGGYSFPSGSAMAAMAALAALLVTAPRSLRPIVAALGVPFVLAYGALLVNEQWHYPTDVLAGWCLALAWVVGMWLVIERRQAPPEQTEGTIPDAHLRRLQ